MNIPHSYNIYGKLICNHSLQEVADKLNYQLGLHIDDVALKKSDIDKHQKLEIKTSLYELVIEKSAIPIEYSIKSAVAGSAQEVTAFANKLFKYLQQAGYSSSFEIYDEKFNFIEAVE
jgi:hypothetical protein